MRERTGRRDLAVLAGGFLAALLLRLAFAALQRENYDLRSFEIVAGIVRWGGDVYRETSRYNYAPVWAYLLWGLATAGQFFGLPLARAVTGALTAVDAASAFLIYRILRNREASARRAAFGSLLFFANPISVFVSSYHGMFDNVSILFLLVAAESMTGRPARPGRAVFAAAASILIKHVTWFHPLLLARRRPPRPPAVAILAPYAIFFASLLPFWASRGRIRAQVFGYQSLGEPYGTEALRFLPGMPPWGTAALCALAALFAVFWIRRLELEFERGCLLLFLVLLIFVPGIAPYYFVWPIAFGALFPGAGYAVYTVIVSLFLVHSPDAIGLEVPHLPGWSGPWWALVFWLLWELRGEQRRRAAAAISGTRPRAC